MVTKEQKEYFLLCKINERKELTIPISKNPSSPIFLISFVLKLGPLIFITIE